MVTKSQLLTSSRQQLQVINGSTQSQAAPATSSLPSPIETLQAEQAKTTPQTFSVGSVSGVTPAELAQAEKLIFRGKTGAAFGDPKMQRIIRELERGGLKSVEQIVGERQDRDIIQREIDKQVQVTTITGAPPGSNSQFEQTISVPSQFEQATGIVNIRNIPASQLQFEKRVTKTKRGVPSTAFVAIDPLTGQERKATKQESAILRSQEVQVSIPEQRGFLAEVAQRVSRKGAEIQARKERGEDVRGISGFLGTIGVGAAKPVIETAQFGQQLVTSPIKTIKQLPSSVARGVEQTFTETLPGLGQTIRQRPGFVGGVILGEIGTDIALGGAFTKVVGVADNVATRLDPRFRKVVDTGDGLVIKGVKTPEGNLIDIPLLKRGDDIGIDLSGQIKAAGKVKNPVSSARDFVKTFSKTKTIKKPIPGEELLTPKTKALLDRFDAGDIRGLDIVDLSERIKKESGSKGLLERSFFADPEGRLRVSRLGFNEQKKATLIDILAGDISFKKPKAQAFLFSDEVIAKFPKSLTDIKNKILKGKPLTKADEARLLKFQITPTGEFKPLGFVGPEPEVTIAPGEIVQAKRVAALTLIDGNKVKVFSAQIQQASPGTKILLNKMKNGVLTPDELAKLQTKFLDETGLSLSSFVSDFKPFLSPISVGGIAISASGKLSKPFSSVKTLSSKGSISPNIKTSKLKSPSPTVSTVSLKAPSSIKPEASILKTPSPSLKSPGTLSKPSGPSKFSSPSKISSPISPSKITKPPALMKGISPDNLLSKKKGRKIPLKSGWVPEVKTGGKFKRFSKPFRTKQQADNYGKWISDNSIAAQHRLKEVKNVKEFSKRRVPSAPELKFRGFRKRKGQEIPLPNFGKIERRKHRLDSRGEVKEINAAKLVAQRFPKKKKLKIPKVGLRGSSFRFLRKK